LIYCNDDPEVKKLSEAHAGDFTKVAYTVHPHEVSNGITSLITPQGPVPLIIFGSHNLQNLQGALEVCRSIGIADANFYAAMQTFKGAARRLEPVKETEHAVIYKDFAHSPSKLKATTSAFKAQFPKRTLIACMELHTFSSLNAKFLGEYHGAMQAADKAFVYFNPHTIEHKKLPPISPDQVKAAFATENVSVYTDSMALMSELKGMNWNESNLLLMTSGNFDGVDFVKLADELI
jgi:UDP-N-acetylmuramate: L-alanyl-gamma-D-glutamyl-meso-diaminopimelate ligase